MSNFIYHFKPKNMMGDFLMPLNELKNEYPDLYDEYVKKYQGRKEILARRIPYLNCLWNDVLHASPINPQVIMDTWYKEGIKPFISEDKKIEVLKIPLELLNEDLVICFQSYNFDYGQFSSDKEKFWPFKKNEFIEQKQVPVEQIKTWHEDVKEGRPLFWYNHTQHILIKQKIDIRLCTEIICR